MSDAVLNVYERFSRRGGAAAAGAPSALVLLCAAADRLSWFLLLSAMIAAAIGAGSVAAPCGATRLKGSSVHLRCRFVVFVFGYFWPLLQKS